MYQKLVDFYIKLCKNRKVDMKKKDLERELTALGWYLKRHGSKHDIWTNDLEQESIPRHNDIDEKLVKKILKKAQKAQLRKAHHENKWKNLEI